jgi:hypothetical protein
VCPAVASGKRDGNYGGAAAWFQGDMKVSGLSGYLGGEGPPKTENENAMVAGVTIHSKGRDILVFGGYFREGLSMESRFTVELVKEIAVRTRGGDDPVHPPLRRECHARRG